MIEDEIGGIVVGCAVMVSMRLGPGMLETIYEEILSYELQNRGFILLRASV